jgi:RNA 2',3'-cyclic 3'-phosphodiesterase
MGKPIHYFFALVPSEKGIDFLRERMDLFRGRGWERFGHFVHPADLHLTLRFLGEIPEETSIALQAGASEIARRTEPFSYGLGRCLLFPRVSRARVIAARVDPGEALPKLVRNLEELCVQNGLPGEERLFRPHLTLARLRNQMKRPNLPSRPGERTQHATHFCLLRTNQSSGPEAYEEVARFSLEGGTKAEEANIPEPEP